VGLGAPPDTDRATETHGGDEVTRDKLKALLDQYGPVAIWTYLVIWLSVLAGFAIAISMGFRTESMQGGAGLLLGVWLATKLTQPLRIAATLALTPLISAVLQKWRRAHPKPPVVDDSSGEA
jgi:hypothetical protein